MKKSLDKCHFCFGENGTFFEIIVTNEIKSKKPFFQRKKASLVGLDKVLSLGKLNQRDQR